MLLKRVAVNARISQVQYQLGITFCLQIGEDPEDGIEVSFSWERIVSGEHGYFRRYVHPAELNRPQQYSDLRLIIICFLRAQSGRDIKFQAIVCLSIGDLVLPLSILPLCLWMYAYVLLTASFMYWLELLHQHSTPLAILPC
jgi:hypothetical protein